MPLDACNGTWFQSYNLGDKTALPASVEYCFHAMALDAPATGVREDAAAEAAVARSASYRE